VVQPAPAFSPTGGGSVAHAYGVTIRGVAYVPNDRRQSFGLVRTCEARDGASCAARPWSLAEQAAVASAAQLTGSLSGFETSFGAPDPEVRVHAEPDGAPLPGCVDGSSTCWFASTDCIERAGELKDANGAPLLDTNGAASWSLTACSRWAISVSLANVDAWAKFLQLDRLHVLRSAVLHEMGHTLGLAHAEAGLMRSRLPVCYFIDPGDARDHFDPTAASDAAQRFECLEGVKPPALSAPQRAQLDAYRSFGKGWSISKQI
jgi:hypothetical protein